MLTEILSNAKALKRAVNVMLYMIRLQIIDTAPEGVYERKNFEQVMRNATAALETTLGYAVLEVRHHPPNMHYVIKGPEVIVKYHMFGHHVQIQVVGKDGKLVELVRDTVGQELDKKEKLEGKTEAA